MSAIALLFAMPSPASAETYQQYLERLRDICAAECLEPKQLQRAARKRSPSEEGDMAIIMDVAEVRQAGNRYELHNIRIDASPLIEQALLGSAGIDTSFGSGVGGLSRDRVTGRHPSVVVIEIDRDTLSDILNTKRLMTDRGDSEREAREEGEEAIVVDGEREVELLEPSVPKLRSYFRGRRVVVRGQPRLTATWVGGRIDRRRKQVTLVLESADRIALLPEYDEDGNAAIVDPQAE
ncbi:hypothetical protein [Erythrobacter sp.]|uniref:hypothetical protein n=1 Tax=Erythrobacter sp. TaxID=1042 RepID=UPI002EAAAEF2|nr:hypothetical protein [Erythrobacter sp.]